MNKNILLSLAAAFIIVNLGDWLEGEFYFYKFVYWLLFFGAGFVLFFGGSMLIVKLSTKFDAPSDSKEDK